MKSYIELLEGRVRDSMGIEMTLSDVTDPPDMSFTIGSECLSTFESDFDDLPKVIKDKFTPEQEQKYREGDIYLGSGDLNVKYSYDPDDGVTLLKVTNGKNPNYADMILPFADGEDILDYITQYEDKPKGALPTLVSYAMDHLRRL